MRLAGDRMLLVSLERIFLCDMDDAPCMVTVYDTEADYLLCMQQSYPYIRMQRFIGRANFELYYRIKRRQTRLDNIMYISTAVLLITAFCVPWVFPRPATPSTAAPPLCAWQAGVQECAPWAA